MLPNWLVVPALVLNVAVFAYLKPWQDITLYVTGLRGMRRIQAFRVAGLLLVLVAVSHAQAVPKTVVGTHDGDWVIAQQMYAEKGINYDGVDWTNFMDFPNLVRYAMWVSEHVGSLLIVAILGFLLLQFGRGGEADETNIHDQLDPDYRTGFVSDYHGDDAFEVPDGMHSEHQPVPVRSRSAAAGR